MKREWSPGSSDPGRPALATEQRIPERLRLVPLALLVLVPALAYGAMIQMSIATRVVVEPSGLRVELDLRNQGDEPALEVVPSVEFQGRIVAGASLAALDPASPRTVVIEVPFAGPTQPRGRWPVLVRVSYTDSAGRPFDAIHVDVARFGDDIAPSSVRLAVPDARVDTEVTIRVRLARRDVSEPIRLAFATPAGVAITPRVITHDPGTPAEVPVSIAAMGATATSRLPLVTIAEYETSEGHQTITAVSMIDIGPSADGARIQVIAILLGTALVGWGAIVIRTRWRQVGQVGQVR